MMADAYSEILGIMRQEGRKDNPSSVQLGIMLVDGACKAGNLMLEPDDLLIAEHLKTGYHFAVDKQKPHLKDKDTFIEPLREGDTVAVLKLDDEKYIILERLVGA